MRVRSGPHVTRLRRWTPDMGPPHRHRTPARGLVVGRDHLGCRQGQKAVGTSQDWQGDRVLRTFGGSLSLPRLPHAWLRQVEACGQAMPSDGRRAPRRRRRQQARRNHVPRHDACQSIPFRHTEAAAGSKVPGCDPAGEIHRRKGGRRGCRGRDPSVHPAVRASRRGGDTHTHTCTQTAMKSDRFAFALATGSPSPSRLVLRWPGACRGGHESLPEELAARPPAGRVQRQWQAARYRPAAVPDQRVRIQRLRACSSWEHCQATATQARAS